MKEQTKAARVFAKIEGASAVMLDSLRRMIEFELEMRRTYPRYKTLPPIQDPAPQNK